jgi:hypothetical protein
MHRYGSVRAIQVWAAGAGVVCIAAMVVLAREAADRITPLGGTAREVLKWRHLVRGSVLPGAIVSWLFWSAIGAGLVMALRWWGLGSIGQQASAPPQPRTQLVMGLVIAAWVIDLAALLWTIRVIMSASDPGRSLRSLGGVMAALVGMLIASVLLMTLSETAFTAKLALAIAGGPPAVIGGGYGLFLLVMMTVGRGTRWN